MASMDVAMVVAQNMLDEITALVDASGAGVLVIYAGTQPTNCSDADTSATKLGEMALNATSFGAASDQTTYAQIALAGVPKSETDADTGGTATFFRVYSSTDGTYANKITCYVQGNITTIADGTGDMQLDSTSIAAGGTITVTQYLIKLNISQ